ncbi:MAG TPA: dihydrolipoamide acetyltransferase family protein [Gemmatimonadales bacterium]|nr:dihydrolipoamide acetyltransferase family protein [Gemmatimonadales bacterium]
MATKIVMEALSPTMEEGRLIEWKKQEGDAVAVGDVLAEVETDKAVMELVARAAGTLLKQAVAAGATVPVSSPVGWIGAPGESVDGAGAAAPASPSPAATPAPPPAAAPAVPRPRAEAPTAVAPTAPPMPAGPAATPAGRIKASPLARRIAADTGVSLSGIAGSGPEGRIIKRDLEGVSAQRSAPAASLAGAPAMAPRAPGTAFTDVPLTQIRKTIAKRLVQSIGPIPTFYLTSEVDMERVAEAREALNAAAGDQGRISFNDIVLKATATALQQHPECNAWWQEDHIRTWHEVHLGVAVATDDGLITPVIRNADQKGLRMISAEIRELADRAKERKLKPEEYTGSSFTVSNLGMLDIEHFTAIINPPEAGILAVGRIAAAPAVINGTIEVRRRMRMTMSCDHRVIDGATGAQFMKTLKLLLENPLALVW